MNLNQVVLSSKISWKGRLKDREGHSNCLCPYNALSFLGLGEILQLLQTTVCNDEAPVRTTWG